MTLHPKKPDAPLLEKVEHVLLRGAAWKIRGATA